MSIQTVKVFHISEIIFEMKLISFAFVQVIQLRVGFAVVIAKHKNSSLRGKPYNYRRNIVFHGAFQEILRNTVFLQRWKPMSKRPIGRPNTRWEDDFWKI